jgi:hypothetical protein
LVLTGLSGKTPYRLLDLSHLSSGPLGSGEVDRFETITIPVSTLTPDNHFQLETAGSLLAYLGEDCWDQKTGGSFFYPTEDGRSFIGTEYVINIPVLSANNEFVVFAYESASVTIEDTRGNTVVSLDMTANSYWKPAKLVAGKTYVIRSTGHVALQSNALEGYTSVPGQHVDNLTSCYNNGATKLLFATWDGNANNVIAVTAQGNATATLWDLDDIQGGGTSIALTKDKIVYHDLPGLKPGYWMLETAGALRVTVQVGLEEDKALLGYVADDIDFSAGFDAKNFWFPSMTQGGHVFLNANDTTVTTNGAVSEPLAATRTLFLAPLRDWAVTADLPIMIETIGGNKVDTATQLNDFGTFVVPAFSVDRNANGVHDHMEDLDDDGNPNACDLDGDGDGIADREDRCPYTTGPDADQDGCPDGAGDGDIDGDGIPDSEDACPDVPEDFDNDLDGDGCPETSQDSDGDGIENEIDNCPLVYNPDQADLDNDGIGDACDDENDEIIAGVGATGGGAVFSCQVTEVATRAAPKASFGLIVRFIYEYLFSSDGHQALGTMDGGR